LFEWGLNWAIASCLHTQLIIHSAVLERNGAGVLLSATSGRGKSTLSAELMLQGWRLLSDELALVDAALELSPLSRPISLKNNSIELIRTRYPDAIFGPLARDTHKGTIGHLRALSTSVGLNAVKVLPRLIVFPKWSASAELSVRPVDAGTAAMRLIDQAFNYSILGEEGFRRMVELVKAAEAWEIEYASLDDAAEVLGELVNELG
jgi:HprK-related kinase A